MKWVFYVIVFVYMFYRAVYGLKTSDISNNPLTLDDHTDYEDGIFLEAGERKVIRCKAPGKNQKIKWINPKGQEIPRIQSKRVYTQYLIQSPHARETSLLLNITEAEVHDSGVWVCRAGGLVRSVSVCVIDSTDFKGTPSEVDADEGRSVNLSCQTKGTPDAMISWTRNEYVISGIDDDDEDMPKYRVMTRPNSRGVEGLLTVMSLSVDDSGVYTCTSIQKTKLADKCTSIQTYNITLNVKHAPSFGDQKNKKVYGQEDESLYLSCNADGYPQPTYHWFIKNEEGETTKVADREVDNDNGSASVLPVKVAENSFDNQYICQASNQLGEDEMIFDILKSTKPVKPDEVEMLPDASSSKALVFNITWYDEIQFDIAAIDVNIMPTAEHPRKRVTEKDWKLETPYEVPMGEILKDSVMATVMDLEPSTEYWVRLRVKNDLGVSKWSNPIKATTKGGDDDSEKEEREVEPEEDEEQTEENDESETTEPEPVAEEDSPDDTTPDDSGRFYGLFFAVGVIIVAVGCTFVARMV